MDATIFRRRKRSSAFSRAKKFLEELTIAFGLTAQRIFIHCDFPASFPHRGQGFANSEEILDG